MSKHVAIAAVLLGAIVTRELAVLGQKPGADAQLHWVGTWATALAPRTVSVTPSGATSGRGRGSTAPTVTRMANGFTDANPQDANSPTKFENETYRQNMRSTIGGDQIRIVFSNRFGNETLEIQAASIALRDKDSAIVPNSVRTLTFNGGSKSVRIPPRADFQSDQLNFRLPARTDFTVDVFIPGSVGSPTSPLTYHLSAFTDSYVSMPGNHVGAASFPVSRDTQSSYLIARVEVVAPPSTGAVVVFGASTTDGARSAKTNARWPEVLADRLNARPGPRMAVLNAGYGGSALLRRSGGTEAALARFDQDVLAVSGVTHLLISHGITDVRASDAPSVEEMIGGYRQLIQRARAHGIRVIGGTLTPIGNTAGFNPASAARWEAVNHWIRTSGEFDGIVDFAKVLADPAIPSQYVAAWTADYTHPSEIGVKKMGDSVDLSLFEMSGPQH